MPGCSQVHVRAFRMLCMCSCTQGEEGHLFFFFLFFFGGGGGGGGECK